MKASTQANIAAAVVLLTFYLCGGGCIGMGLKHDKAVDKSQVVFGSALVAIPTITLGIFFVCYLMGYNPAARAAEERQRHEHRLQAQRRGLSPPQGGANPVVPASWTPIAQLRDARDHLGEKLATFQHIPGHGEAFFVAGFVFLGGLVLLVVSCISMAKQKNSGTLGLVLLLLSLLVMAGSLFGLVFALRRKPEDLRLLIFEKGLVRVDRGRFIVFLWEDILELYQVIVDVYQYGVVHTAREYGFGLNRCDGEGLSINEGVSPRDVGPLSDLLQAKVAEHLLPQVRRQYRAGEDIVFGPLTLNRQGISNGKEMIPWSRVDEVTIAEGVVRIRKAGNWLSWSKVEARDIPNLHVFLTLVDEIVGVNR